MEQFIHNKCIMNADRQAKLAGTKVSVIGAGGLGGFVLQGLSRLGCQNIKIVDNDVFQESNLNRQCFCDKRTLGKSKALAAAEAMRFISDAEIVPLPVRLDGSNAEDLLKGSDVVFDCVDNAETKRLLEEKCLEMKIPLVHGGVNKMFGQAALIMNKPILHSLMNAPIASENAVIMPQIVAGFQLSLFVKYLKNEYEADALYFIDADSMEITKF